MMNKFIQIEMAPAAGGRGGFFHTEADFLLDNFKAPFCGIEVKIDTGCSISTIPLRRLKVSDALCRILKGADIAAGIPYYLSYGVESGGLKHAVPVTDGQKMDCPAMKYENKTLATALRTCCAERTCAMLRAACVYPELVPIFQEAFVSWTTWAQV